MIQFFAPDIAINPILPESESAHCVKVLRTPAGSEIEVVDGRGNTYTCRLVEAHAKHAMVEIISRKESPLPWPYSLTIAVAPTKHMDRMEWLVEKLTETGINRLIPALTDRSERREIKHERLEKTAVSAMKQSLKASMPQIEPMTPLRRIIENATEPNRFICYCDDSVNRHVMAREITPGADTIILIGPEGDFSPSEVELALKCGFRPVSLGRNRLRTETAALFAASTVHIVNQITSHEE